MPELPLKAMVFDEIAAEVLARERNLTFKGYGTSMLPLIRSGSLITIIPIDVRNVKNGEVVLYRGSRGLAVHRVISRTDDCSGLRLMVAGDMNTGPPEAVVHSDVLGKLVTVKHGRYRFDIDKPIWRVLGLLWYRIGFLRVFFLHMGSGVNKIRLRLVRRSG